MPNLPTIANARPEDATSLSALAFRSKAYWDYDAQFMEACREELSVPAEAFADETIRMALLDEQMAGFHRLIIHSDTADLEALFVDPRFIGKGIGGALWRDVLENVENAGVARLYMRNGDDFSGRSLFNCAIQPLPGFEKKPEFVF